MARGDRAATARRLYERFVAPLVLGGPMTAGPAIGARDAFALDGGLAAVDPDLRSQVDVARVRVARRLVAVDMLEGPSREEWALAAALHDLVHALHPGLTGGLHARVPERLLAFADSVVARVPHPRSLAEAVSRHSYFARAVEIERTDTTVTWWTGSRRFQGRAPPSRLLAWPDVRRVHTDRTQLQLAELAELPGAGRQAHCRSVLERFLSKTPLTDLATCARDYPAFAWTGSTLGIFGSVPGRALGLRALALGDASAVDAALARALAPFVKAAAWGDVARIGDVLAERMLLAALHGPPRDVSAERGANADGVGARALGAVLALVRIRSLPVSQAIAQRTSGRLLPLTQSQAGREAAAIAARLKADHFLASALENAAGSVGGSRTSSDE